MELSIEAMIDFISFIVTIEPSSLPIRHRPVVFQIKANAIPNADNLKIRKQLATIPSLRHS